MYVIEVRRKYIERNKERIREYFIDYRKRNKDRLNDYIKNWTRDKRKEKKMSLQKELQDLKNQMIKSAEEKGNTITIKHDGFEFSSSPYYEKHKQPEIGETVGIRSPHINKKLLNDIERLERILI